MIRSTSQLVGFSLLAKDGEIGSCSDLLFDDQQWTVRYLVAKTGGWLTNRKVLIAPETLKTPQWDDKKLPVQLFKAEIEKAPPIDADAPVSRQYQLAWTSYYQLSPYWQSDGPLASPLVKNSMAMTQLDADQDEHLRSCYEVIGYQLRTKDSSRSENASGVIKDFLFDDQTWQILYAVTEILEENEKQKVLIDRSWLEGVACWSAKTLTSDLTSEQLRDCPVYDESRPLNPRLNENEFTYYGFPK